MANLWKHTVTFSFPGYGASETWYFQSASTNTRAVLDSLDMICSKRAKLLGTDAYLITSRAQLVQYDYPNGAKEKRVGLIKTLNLRGVQTVSGNPNYCCDNGISLKVLAKDHTTKFSKFVMMPATWSLVVPTLNSFNPNSTFMTYFNDWSTAIIAQGYGWLGSNRAPQKADITGYAFDNATGLTTFTLGGAGLTWPNSNLPVRVHVSFPKRNWLDGTYLVTHTANITCRTVNAAPAPPFLEKGEMTITPALFYSLKLDPATQTSAEGFIIPQASMRRKRGRPLYASRGRDPVHIQTWQG